MNTIDPIARSNVFFSCTGKEYRSIENNIAEHVLVHIYAGSLSVTDAQGSYTIQAGDTALFYRNMLARFVKYPAINSPFKSIAISFSSSFLRQYYLENKAIEVGGRKQEVQLIRKHPLISSLFGSILPYYDIDNDGIPEPLTIMKLREAITVIRTIHKEVDFILGNFLEDGKIDLVDFMQKNYAFNIPIEKFAYLTGRSLATFKRDFVKAFQLSPQRWLLEKRLKEAHYQISQQQKKPSDVYLQVGFENLSHFSRSFKQYFGYNPSQVNMSSGAK